MVLIGEKEVNEKHTVNKTAWGRTENTQLQIALWQHFLEQSLYELSYSSERRTL